MTRWMTLCSFSMMVACTPDESLELSEIQSQVNQLVRLPPIYSGCADAHFYASNQSDTIGLGLTIDGLASDAFHAGQTITYEYALPDPSVFVTIELGENVTSLDCNDAIIPGQEPVVVHTLQLVSGELTATATPEVGASDFMPYATADVILENAVFQTAQGTLVTADAIEMYDVYIGWLAG